MPFPAPPIPAFPPERCTTATGFLRYEDVTQDGRLLPIAVPPALGYLWRDRLVGNEGARNAIAQGIIPILTRMTLVSSGLQIRVDRPTEVRAGFELAHDSREGTPRLYMNVWCELRGAAGRLAPGVTPGELQLAGYGFAEHTFTRLMAPPDQRRVTSLAGVKGYPEIPEAHYAAPAPATAQEPPDGARWLDELAPDPVEVCFTLDHTDSNQHVNSLTYIRIFLDAIGRRLAASGRALRVRSRAVDIAYRKPSFAGDRVRAQLRLFDLDGQLGAAGLIAGTDDKPRCYVRALLAA